jgi:N-acetylneuraminic acid mutarotase
MKLKILIILSLVTIMFATSCTDDTTVLGNWVKKAYFVGSARSNGSSFAINGEGYWGMGKDEDDYLPDFWKYSPEKNTWTEVAEFPGKPRAYNISVSNGEKGYVGLGYDGDNDLADFWEYDPKTNKWTRLEDFPGGPRRFAAAFAIGKDIYVGTGITDNGKKYLNDFYKYSNGKWDTTISALSGEKRHSASAVSFNGKGYIISGYRSTVLNDFWEYDPESNTWDDLDLLTDEDTGDAAIPRHQASTFVSGGNIYLVGGISSGTALSSVYEWNPIDAIWSEKASIESNVTRQGAGSFVINDNGYIIGGRNGSYYLDDFYMFEPWVEKDIDD